MDIIDIPAVAELTHAAGEERKEKKEEARSTFTTLGADPVVVLFPRPLISTSRASEGGKRKGKKEKKGRRHTFPDDEPVQPPAAAEEGTLSLFGEEKKAA